MAIGIMKNVAGFAVAIRGTRPINVVTEVRKIGRKPEILESGLLAAGCRYFGA